LHTPICSHQSRTSRPTSLEKRESDDISHSGSIYRPEPGNNHPGRERRSCERHLYERCFCEGRPGYYPDLSYYPARLGQRLTGSVEAFPALAAIAGVTTHRRLLDPDPRRRQMQSLAATNISASAQGLGLTKSETPNTGRTTPILCRSATLLPQRRCGLRKLPFAVASAAPDVRLGGLAPWRIRRLQAFVEEHLSQSIHVADLSGAVGLSVPHFSRAFGLSFGEPPHLYVIQRRLDRARHLMLTSNMALSELAVACGFNDQAHLCRLFRQHTGRTPAAWRREWRDAIRQGHLIEEWLMKNDFQPVVGHRFNFRAAKNGGLAP